GVARRRRLSSGATRQPIDQGGYLGEARPSGPGRGGGSAEGAPADGPYVATSRDHARARLHAQRWAGVGMVAYPRLGRAHRPNGYAGKFSETCRLRLDPEAKRSPLPARRPGGGFRLREEVTGVLWGQPRLYERLSAVSSSQFWAKLRTATTPAAAADESRPMSARSGSAGAATRPAK